MSHTEKERQRQRIYAHRHSKTPDSRPIETECSWCGRTNVFGTFMYVPPSAGKKTSHGICGKCIDKIIHDKNMGLL